MNITAAAPTVTIVRPANTAVTLSEAKEAAPEAPKDTFKSNVTKAAYAGCGALGGLALGAVSGTVMSHLTHNPIFSTLGGGVGAIGGAATSLALGLSDQPVHMGRVFGSWAGASAGATGGMFAMQEFGKFLGQNGAATYFPTHGALIGAAGAGLAGMGVAFAGDESKVGKLVRSSAKAGAGALAGMAVGGGIQAILATNLPNIVQLSAPAPFVLAGALALVGVQNDVNRGWVEGYQYKPESANLDTATKTVLGGTAAYLGGSVVAGIALTAGASPLYGVIAPVLGAAVGAGAAYGSVKENKTVSDFSSAAGIAGGAAVLGDAVGHGLSALTGMPVFRMAGAAVGAIAGGSAALDSQKRLPKYIAPVALGFTAGATAGTLLGAGLTALTGQHALQYAGTAIGSVAGVLLCLAGRANS